MCLLRRLAVILFLALIVSCVQGQSALNWVPEPSLLTPRDSGATIMGANGSIYVLAGNTSLPRSVEFLADIDTAWTPAPLMPQGRIAPGAVIATNAAFFVFGGKNNGRAVKETFYYLNGGGSNNQASMKTARYRFAFANTLYNIYAIGGLDSNDQPMSAVEFYYQPTNRWTQITPLPEARSNFQAVSDGSNIITFGGSIVGSAVTNTVYRLTTGINTWSQLAPMPVATRDSAVVFGDNNLIYVIGGFSATGAVNTVQIYNTVTDTWRLGTPLPFAVGSASAAINRSGKILVTGGIGTSGANVANVWSSFQENAPPVFTPFFSTSVNAGETFSAQMVANGNPSPTFSLVVGPAEISVDENSGELTWRTNLSDIGAHEVTIRATNVAGFADSTFTINVYPPAPTGLTAGNITGNTATLAWNAFQTDSGTTSYRVYSIVHRSRGSISYALAGETSSTTFNVNGLSSGFGYGYVVTNVVNGLESAKSVSASFLTLQPSAPVGVTVTAQTQTSVTLSWSAPPASPLPVVAFRIYGYNPNTFQFGVWIDNITGTSATITGLLPNTSYQFYVVSLDAVFNQSGYAAPPLVTTSSLPSLFHVFAFQRPTNYGGGYFPETVAAINGDRLMLVSAEAHSWAVLDYIVGTNGLPRATFSMVSGPSGMTINPITGVVSWTNVSAPVGVYTATVRGTNVEGSTDFSFNYTVYPAGSDLLSPTEPLYFVTNATNVTRTSATINWSPSTDNVGVAGYKVFISSPPPPCGRIGGCPPLPTTIAPIAVVSGSATSVTINNLTPGTAYGMWVQAFDAAGNTSFLTAAVRQNFVTQP
jgi:Fibronectin type III domain/Kelch motif/Putative Ig domain